MANKKWKWPARILIAVVIIYLVGGALLYFAQDLILFHPKSLPKEHKFKFDLPYQEMNIPFGKENLNFVKFLPDSSPKGIVLFYHGNMNNVEHYNKYPALFVRNGFEFWMIDYPGFGKTSGKRNEEVIYQQALVMYEMANKKMAGSNLIIYGKSIGTGVASYVASVKNARQLFLETPYFSIPALSRSYFPVYPSFLSKYSFPNYKHIAKIKIPVTIIHGTKDEIVPYNHSKKLKKENPRVHFVTIPGGKHNDLFEYQLYQSTMDSLLKK